MSKSQNLFINVHSSSYAIELTDHIVYICISFNRSFAVDVSQPPKFGDINECVWFLFLIFLFCTNETLVQMVRTSKKWTKALPTKTEKIFPQLHPNLTAQTQVVNDSSCMQLAHIDLFTNVFYAISLCVRWTSFNYPNNALISLCMWHKKSTYEKLLSDTAAEVPWPALSSHR